MTAIVTFDEGPGAGLGHRRRCEVLAAALRRRGIETIAVPLDASSGRVDAPLIVVDSYRVRADDKGRIRGGLVVALDDLARDLDVAIVVDPAPGAAPTLHRRAGTVLAGARYSLVDPDLRSLGARAASMSPHTIVVATGAADADGVGAAIATSLVSDPDIARSCEVRLVVGPWGSRATPDGVETIERSDGLAVDLAAADIVVTAAGVTLLEALCLGRPTVAVSLAPNQRANIEGVVVAGAALASDAVDVAVAVRRLLGDAELRGDLSQRAAALIDGCGADRIVETIIATGQRAAA